MTREEKLYKIYKTIMIPFYKKKEMPDCMIGDVFDWIEDKYGLKIVRIKTDIEYITKLYELRKDKRGSIGKQNEDCINYLYSLIPTQ